MLKVLLVDDEFPARGELQCLLEEIGGFKIVGECEDGDEALEWIKAENIDVVFLDIQMSGKDGLTTAWEIIQIQNHPKIVFTTGYDEYAVKAFELNAIDYVMKPYSKKRLEHTTKKIMSDKNIVEKKEEEKGNEEVFNLLDKGMESQIDRISVWASDRLVVIGISEIYFARAESKGRTMLFTERGQFCLNKTLKMIEEKINSLHFLRTHKRYYVNLEKISEIIPWFNNTYVLLLEGCTEKNIPVSRHYIKEFNRLLGI
ncbi:MAG: DNA-binding response regulator [Firmicutes bacterium HGW-Firmicutes-12]|jgi:DNA-binding LytR/AlgR family response regulator|nr:MAG: DNA-binding response regulator [Firmicutes bacterium HGW-Firmicutes-12]